MRSSFPEEIKREIRVIAFAMERVRRMRRKERENRASRERRLNGRFGCIWPTISVAIALSFRPLMYDSRDAMSNRILSHFLDRSTCQLGIYFESLSREPGAEAERRRANSRRTPPHSLHEQNKYFVCGQLSGSSDEMRSLALTPIHSLYLPDLCVSRSPFASNFNEFEIDSRERKK